MSKGHVDVAAGGAFLSLTINEATALIEKMVANQRWGEGRKRQKGSQSAKEADVFACCKNRLAVVKDGPTSCKSQHGHRPSSELTHIV